MKQTETILNANAPIFTPIKNEEEEWWDKVVGRKE